MCCRALSVHIIENAANFGRTMLNVVAANIRALGYTFGNVSETTKLTKALEHFVSERAKAIRREVPNCSGRSSLEGQTYEGVEDADTLW
jgi:hypothetical protein